MAVITFANITTVNASKPTVPDGLQAITPADADTFNLPVKVYVGGAGNVVYKPANGGATVTVPMIAGSYLPSRAIAVLFTGTTATGLFAVL